MGAHHTIFALASGVGRAGVAVVRVSGPDVAQVYAALTSGDWGQLQSHLAHVAVLRDPASREVLDEALVLGFKAPRSFTGEDVLELQCHGAPIIVERLLDCLAGLPNCRLAKAGEFSRRAFYNDKMSLMEVEGLGGLLEADTLWQKDLSRPARIKAQEKRIRGWRDTLLTALADVEAAIDFADEDLGELDARPWDAAIAALRADLQDCVAQSSWLERHAQGFTAVLAGPPNAGKSSLINQLVGRDLAFVDAVAGTTRDAIEAALVLDSVPLVLIDTAGLHGAAQGVEALGVAKAQALWAEADIKLSVIAPGQQPLADCHMVVATHGHAPASVPSGASLMLVDNISGAGIPQLRQALAERVRKLAWEHPLDMGLSSGRQRDLARDCLEALELAAHHPAEEIIAESLREALLSLSRLLGEYDVEEMLDRLFANFCIGK